MVYYIGGTEDYRGFRNLIEQYYEAMHKSSAVALRYLDVSQIEKALKYYNRRYKIYK